MRFLRVSPVERDVAQAAGLRHPDVVQAGSLRYRTDERGQGALEFRLAFPLVVTVLLGIMELSIAVSS